MTDMKRLLSVSGRDTNMVISRSENCRMGGDFNYCKCRFIHRTNAMAMKGRAYRSSDDGVERRNVGPI